MNKSIALLITLVSGLSAADMQNQFFSRPSPLLTEQEFRTHKKYPPQEYCPSIDDHETYEDYLISHGVFPEVKNTSGSHTSKKISGRN